MEREPVYDALVNKHSALKTQQKRRHSVWCQYQMVSKIHKGMRLLSHSSLLARYVRPSRHN